MRRQEDIYIPSNVNIPYHIRLGYLALRFFGSVIALGIVIFLMWVAQAINQGGLN